MKKQILIIHGGSTFDTYQEYFNYLKKYKFDNLEKLDRNDWKVNLSYNLGKNFQVIRPQMTCARNAKYKEWKVWFEKLFPFLKNDIILIGHSLGGIFLLKYLAQNKFPVLIKQLHLVASPTTEKKETLGDFVLPKNLDRVIKQVKNIFIYQSKDDKIVPFSDFKKLTKFFPDAEKIIFENRGHFNQKRFRELENRIKNNL